MGIEAPPRFGPGDKVLTSILPGLDGEVLIVDVLSIRGHRFYVVVVRDEPDLIVGLRPEGTVRRVSDKTTLSDETPQTKAVRLSEV